ncbi:MULTISPECIES: MarR family winged helix-turn-helix transcriptional regulator [Pseudomonas]|uniref:Transcriptional regulator, MarR family n=1 Tax=Pseudomonas delhiensis TaxID=366289 RepID=A0A239MI80_9PSED|nr:MULTISPECIES: MarR family winged helix-turn-helix transcriptional regulator [Pseudomonas]MED5612037.1 MarR family winged helix-turn-helix transcriptional regulator [Pseudomonas sp. JH-2]PWU26997.1 MarR family transcriptional regulator [Pseudomonas sp. RW407]SDJ62816.1 transcriptional regulator, MarR family [Pseudomonas delhiensis]SNT42415.1 transcriptional regulator, MarR family [Pseudomonas delhiensis]
MLTTQCLCTQLRRAARGVTRVYDDALQGIGLTVAQFSLLRHLARLEQPSISELAEAMGLDRSTLGRNLRPLQAEGLVVLQGDAGDQRNRLVLLTAAGRERLEQGAQPWEAAQRRMYERLGAERREQLMALLGELEALD